MTTARPMALTLAVVLLLACGNGTGLDDEEGILAATLSGAVSERYQARGEYVGIPDGSATFVAAELVSVGLHLPSDGLTVQAVHSREGFGYGVSVLVPEYGGAGSYTGVVSVSRRFSATHRTERFFRGEATIRVTSASNGRVTGTFSGKAPDGFLGIGQQGDTVYVADGAFDAPLLSPP